MTIKAVIVMKCINSNMTIVYALVEVNQAVSTATLFKVHPVGCRLSYYCFAKIIRLSISCLALSAESALN